MNPTTIEQILAAAKQYDEDHRDVPGDMPKTNARLVALIEKYGVDKVSAASGLKVSSLMQYTRKSSPPVVSGYTVIKAETVLNQF